MPLTVDDKTFETRTKRGAFSFRSKRFKNVLACFTAYHKTDNDVDLKHLKRAWETWMITDPKEYAGRDKASTGLCATLAGELKVNLAHAPKKPQLFAHQITCKTGGADAARAIGQVKCLDRSVEDFLATMADKPAEVGIFLIDMQSKTGTSTDLTGIGAAERYNSDTVFENQQSVLMAANAYGMTVFEIRIVKTLQAQSDDGVVSQVFHNDPTMKGLSDLFPTKPTLHVKIDKPFYNSFQGTNLDKELATRAIKTVVVMGFDANLCVKNTIFGTPKSFKFIKEGKVDTPYQRGLLDRGFTVVTSRPILAASRGAKLDGEYQINA